MPIYEYRCDSCGFQKEFIQRMSDPRLTDCPDCKKPALNKMVTAAGFQLKGSGWYVTDFRDGGKNTSAAKKTKEKQSDTSAKAEGGKTDGKTESAASTTAAKSESSGGGSSGSSSGATPSTPSTPSISSASATASKSSASSAAATSSTSSNT